MTLDVHQFAIVVSWIATAIGIGLWAWGALEKNVLRRVRMGDCGTVLIFSSVMLRLVGQARSMTVIDWALAILSPLFVAAALWRLARTGCPEEPKGGLK